MPRDSQGNCTQPYDWNADAANGIGIESDRHQENDDDHLTMLTQSLDRQGRGGMQADLAMGNFKVTQVNEGTAASDAPNIGQAQTEAYQTSTTETGTANAYQITLSPAPTAYTTGLTVKFVAANANTGASTLQVGGLTPAPALQWHSKDLEADTIAAGAVVEAVFTGSVFELLNPPEVLPSAYGGTGSTQALGTAAFQDVGTAVGNVTQLEDVSGSAGLPAVDGSQLTGVFNSVKTQVFTAGGTYTKPNGLIAARFEVVGGGGGGGGTSGIFQAAGGGAGGYSSETLAASAIGATETVIVGTGGTGGTNAGTGGGAGNPSSVGALLSANGGAGGDGATGDIARAGGLGGTSTGGDYNQTGGDGGGTAPGTGGMGGASYLGGGGRGGNGAASQGQPGKADGSGGGGAGGGANSGGNGKRGIVIVTEYLS